MRPRVYLDHNATTPVRAEVLEAMLPYLREEFGNPNSPHQLGQRARGAVERAREQVAALVGAADAQEIVFTSCGSEADVTAIAGAAWQVLDETSQARRGLVSTRIEHDAVRGILEVLKKRGFSVDLAGVDAQGLIGVAEISGLITEATAVVSVMHSNNEVGTLQPISAVAAACRGRGALLHTDAVQSAGKVPIDVGALGVDLLAISGHKINAPKGVGALYVRRGVKLAQTITGHQEKNRRGGTENVASIVGLGLASELARRELEAGEEGPRGRYQRWREKIDAGVLGISGSRVNGHPERRLPHCSHFSFSGLDGHQLVVALDLEGIAVSSGPACSSGASMASHVLTAMGLDAGLATGSLRVSMGHGTAESDIDRLLAVLPWAVERLRRAAGGRPALTSPV